MEMAVLRLFAQAREAAGTSGLQVPAASVGDLLDEAARRFGTRFDEVLATSKVWLNGEPTELSVALADDDEVAVLPPVSGGCR